MAVRFHLLASRAGAEARRRPALGLASGLAGCLLLGAGPARAQSLEYQDGNFLRPPPGIGGPHGGLASGDVSGDLSPELAVVKGTSLVVFHGADVGNDAVVLATDALDVCFCSVADDLGNPGFLFTTQAGLGRAIFQADDYDAQLIDASPLWQGAKLIRSGPGVGGGPGEGLVGLAENERDVFLAFPSGSGFTAPTVIFTLATRARDVVLLEWDMLPDAQQEIGVLHRTGLQVRTQAGGILLSRSGIVPGDAIAVVRKAGLGDSLAWVTRLGNGQSYLLLFNPTLPGGYEGPDLLGPLAFGSIAAGDLDADGDDDLVLAPSAADYLEIDENDSPPGSWSGAFSPGSMETVDMSIGPATGGSAASVGARQRDGRVLCANLFNDHDAAGNPLPGLALVLGDRDGVRLRPGPEARASFGEGPDFTLVTCETALFLSGCPDSGVPTQPGRWAIELGNGWGTPPGASHVQMVVRRFRTSQSNPDQIAFHHQHFPLVGNQVAGTTIDFLTSSVVDPALDPAEDSDTRYFVMARPIRRVGPSINKAWRWSILGMSANCDSFLWMQHLPGAGDQVIQPAYSTCLYVPQICDPHVMGSRYIPSAVPMSSIPGSGPGVLPIVYAPDY